LVFLIILRTGFGTYYPVWCTQYKHMIEIHKIENGLKQLIKDKDKTVRRFNEH